jgi:hypothetical protein
MKALTINQPFASLIVNPPHVKRVENRSWRTHFRGPLAIHAGKSRKWRRQWKDELPDPMPMRAVVGVVQLVDCVHVDEIATREDLAWLRDHPHAFGPFCWILADARPLPTPVPYAAGQLNFWDLPPDVVVD